MYTCPQRDITTSAAAVAVERLLHVGEGEGEEVAGHSV